MADGRRWSRQSVWVLFPGFLILACALLSGCAAGGFVANKLTPPPRTDAEYTLPKKPTLVLVENYNDPSGSLRADAETLSRYIYDDLLKQTEKKGDKQVPVFDLVDWKKIHDLHTADPAAFQKMTIHEVGKALGAGQVIYVQLLYSDLLGSIGGDMLRGRAGVRARVVDCETGQTLWPSGTSQGEPLGFETELLRAKDGVTGMEVRDDTLQGLGKKIARLFHEWGPQDD